MNHLHDPESGQRPLPPPAATPLASAPPVQWTPPAAAEAPAQPWTAPTVPPAQPWTAPTAPPAPPPAPSSGMPNWLPADSQPLVDRASHLRPGIPLGTPPAPPPIVHPGVRPPQPSPEGLPIAPAGLYHPEDATPPEPTPTDLAWWLARPNRVAMITGAVSAITVLLLIVVAAISIAGRIGAENSAQGLADQVAGTKSDDQYVHSQLRQAQSDIAARRETAGYLSMYIANAGPVNNSLVGVLVDCGSASTACSNSVGKLQSDFQIWETSRAAVKVPPSLAGADADLKKGIGEAVQACKDMNAGVRSGSGTQFGSGYGELDNAFKDINQADSLLSSELSQEGTSTAPL